MRPLILIDALQTRQAILAGHFADAGKQVRAVEAISHAGPWFYEPFDDYIEAVAAPGTGTADTTSSPDLSARLEQWTTQSPHSAVAWLLRADHAYDTAWHARGHGFSDSVTPAHASMFKAGIEVAQSAVEQAVALAPRAPYARYLQLKIDQASQGPGAAGGLARDFKAAIAAVPGYYPLYAVQLDSLQPKWGGTVAQMRAFVDQVAGNAQANAPLKMLYLRLFTQSAQAAVQRCRRHSLHPGPETLACVRQVMGGTQVQKYADAAGNALLATALAADTTNRAAHDEIVMRSMTQLIRTPGMGPKLAMLFLQALARVTHGSVQLPDIETHDTNPWVLDALLAAVWYHDGQYATAEKLDDFALRRLAAVSFGDPQDANDARASLHDALASAYNHQDNYREVVRHEAASARLTGGMGARPGYNRLACEALYRLKRYDVAVTTCTAILAASDDWQARYFLAHTLEAQGHTVAALAAFRIVTDSSADKGYRGNAAIEMSILQNNAGHYHRALAILHQYRDVFDLRSQGHYGMASYYNDLCYTEMKLDQDGRPSPTATLRLATSRCPMPLRNRPDCASGWRGPTEIVCRHHRPTHAGARPPLKS